MFKSLGLFCHRARSKAGSLLVVLMVLFSLSAGAVASAQTNMEVAVRVDSIDLMEGTGDNIHLIFTASDAEGNSYTVDS
ncbi:hypothetical protein HQ524_02175, partial [Candidatus Uhrbacteria bacterium]|nr:hypothetical protein [Candidatus Uhrbacteria bacterium]